MLRFILDVCFDLELLHDIRSAARFCYGSVFAAGHWVYFFSGVIPACNHLLGEAVLRQFQDSAA